MTEVSSDEEIIKANKDSRIHEFFELAINSRDPLVQIELYKNVLEVDPNHKATLNNIGVSLNNIYDYPKAIEYLNAGIELFPEYAIAYANRANSFNHLNDLIKAMEDVNKSLLLNSSLDWGYSVKGNILTKLGKLKEAEDVFGLAIKLNPNSGDSYMNRGFFYEENEEFEKSKADYKKSEELGVQSKAMLYNNFAVLYRRLKKFDKAKKFIEKARKENPNFPNIDGTLALIYADQGDRDNFYKYLTIALEKGCPAWNYIKDPGFDDFREEEKLKKLLEMHKKRYIS